MFERAVPVLHVSRSEVARAFYCDRLGFRETFTYRPDATRSDPRYLGLVREGVEIHLSSFSGDAVPGGVVYLVVEDVDRLHEELLARGVAVDLAPVDQTWGNREMYVRDADGNCLRFVRPLAT